MWNIHRKWPIFWPVLTERESDVLRRVEVAQGLMNKEIGERLVLCHRTVQTHLYRIFSMLGHPLCRHPLY